MEHVRIRVECHEGHRGAERPVAFHLGGERVEVREILRSWVEEDSHDRRRSRCFRLEGGDGRIHTVCHDEAAGEWFYLRSDAIRRASC